MNIYKHTTYDIEYDGLTFELMAEPINEPIFRKVEGGYIVGYLTQDELASYPPDDWDGCGKIGTSNTRDRRELNDIYREALGLTNDWQKRYTLEDAMAEVADEQGVAIAETPKEIAAILQAPGRKSKLARLIQQNMDKARERGDFGDPDAVLLDVYEHGGRVYHVGYNANFPDRQWDCAYGGAVWVPDDVLRDQVKGLDRVARNTKMIQFAEQCVEAVNQWSSGDVYVIWLQKHSKDGVMLNYDVCGGYFGSKYAEEELASQVKAAKL